MLLYTQSPHLGHLPLFHEYLASLSSPESVSVASTSENFGSRFIRFVDGFWLKIYSTCWWLLISIRGFLGRWFSLVFDTLCPVMKSSMNYYWCSMARKRPAAGTPFRNLAHGNAKARSFRGRNWPAKKARTFGAWNRGRYMEPTSTLFLIPCLKFFCERG